MVGTSSGGYAGDLSPMEAWERLAGHPRATLVDVRTRAEWTYVGVPVLADLGKEAVFLEWQSFPSGAPVPDFVPALSAALAAAGRTPDDPVLFICRSGGRSRAAAIAATAAGFREAYNVAEGFEGPLDEEGHRGMLGGWKAAGLPWAQS